MPVQNVSHRSCFNGERDTKLRNGKRGRYTLEFKQEAVRLVESGQSIAETARWHRRNRHYEDRGWRTRSVFERYAIVSRNHIADAMQKLQTSEAELAIGHEIGHAAQATQTEAESQRVN